MKLSVKKFSKKSLSLLIALIMIISALPFTPPISAEAAVITSYEKTGYYDFTSDYDVGTTGNNAIDGYTGTDFVLSAKSWDGILTNTKDGTTRTAGTTSDTLDVVYQKNLNVVSAKANQTTEYSYSADTPTTQTITTSVDSLFFRDGLINIPNVSSYISNEGFRISWTEQYFSKSNGREAGNGVFCLAYSSGGFETNLFKWSTSDNKFYQGSTSKVECAPLDSHVYDISLIGDSNGYITVKVYDRNTSSTVINYTSTITVSYSDLTKVAIGSGDYSLAKFGKFAISNLSIEKASTTGSLDRTKTPTTSVTGLNGDLKLRWFSESDVKSVTGTPEGSFTMSDVSGYKAVTFNNNKFSFTVSNNLQSAGLSTNIDGNTSSQGMTIAFMARFGTYSDAPIFTLHNENYDTTSGKKTIFSVSSNGKVNYTNGSGATNNQQLTNPPALNTWHTYIVKFYGSKKLEIWIDGKPQKFKNDGSLTHGSEYYDNHTFDIPNVIKVGADAGNTTYFNGSIRDFRVYQNNQNSVTLHKNLLAIANETQSREEITASAYGVVSDNINTNRITTSAYMNVVNDGQSGSTNAGILKFDISSLKNGGYRVGENTKLRLKVYKTWFDTSYINYNSDDTYSAYTVTSGSTAQNISVETGTYSSTYYANSTDSITTDVYYSLDSANASRVGGVDDRKSTSISGFSTSNTSADTVKSNVALLGVTDTTSPLGSIPHKNMTFYDINVADVVNDALDKGKTEIYFILVKNKYDGSSSGNPWSDTHFKLDEQQLIIDKTYTADFVNAAGQVVSTVTALNSADAYFNKPSNTQSKIESNNDGTHNVTNYSWSLTPTNNVFSENVDVKSNVTCSGGTATCTSKAVCSVCGAEHGALGQHSFEINSLDFVRTRVEADEINNGYYYAGCRSCGLEDTSIARVYDDVSSYWNTYRDLLAQAKDKIAENEATNGAKYNSDTINALNEAIARVTKVGDEKKSQTYIENENTILQTAITAVKLNQYSITVKYVDENSELGTDTITNVDYGTIKDVTAKTKFNDKDYVVYKWTRSTKDGDKLLGLNSTSISVNVIGDLTYYVHLKSTQAESSTNTAVVTLNNKAGKPVDVGYVTTNEAQDVVVNGNTIQIGTNTTLTAPQYSFYDIKGFIVNGELITTDSGTKSITVTENMSIIPLYSATKYVNITRNSVETFTINGKDIDSYLAKWDELITLESTGEVIWCTTKGGSEVVLGQGASLKFRANEAIEIYTKPIGEALSPISRVGYFGYDADLKKVTIVNNFFVPDGANENVKAGVVVSTKEKTRDELITQCEAGSLKFEGGYDKFTADKNQLRISINRSGTGDFSMWALSYVVVGNTTYYASEVSTYTYNSSATA